MTTDEVEEVVRSGSRGDVIACLENLIGEGRLLASQAAAFYVAYSARGREEERSEDREVEEVDVIEVMRRQGRGNLRRSLESLLNQGLITVAGAQKIYAEAFGDRLEVAKSRSAWLSPWRLAGLTVVSFAVTICALVILNR